MYAFSRCKCSKLRTREIKLFYNRPSAFFRAALFCHNYILPRRVFPSDSGHCPFPRKTRLNPNGCVAFGRSKKQRSRVEAQRVRAAPGHRILTVSHGALVSLFDCKNVHAKPNTNNVSSVLREIKGKRYFADNAAVLLLT